jgi:hypothetical protein
MNKKATGTATSFLIAAIVAFSIIFSIGLLINNLTSTYQKTEITYFDGFGELRNETGQIGGDFVVDYDDEKEEEKGFFKTLQTRFEDMLFYKAFKAVKNVGTSINSVRKGIYKVGVDLEIPSVFITLLITIFGIVIVALIIKIIRGFSEI